MLDSGGLMLSLIQRRGREAILLLTPSILSLYISDLCVSVGVCVCICFELFSFFFFPFSWFILFSSEKHHCWILTTNR